MIVLMPQMNADFQVPYWQKADVLPAPCRCLRLMGFFG